MNPFLISSLVNAGASILGMGDDKRQARANADRANQQSKDAASLAYNRNRKSAAQANQWSAEQAAIAERRSDENAQIAREFNAREAAKANVFTANQNTLQWQRSEARDLRNRDWALQDYEQQKEDYSTQFVRLREAAEAGGFNPLSVLGSQMTPGMGAGGLSSSAYGAGVGVGASSGFAPAAAPTASVPMAYASDVAVQPLTSNAGVVGAVGEFGREISGANAVQRQTDELYRDLAQIQLDQMRSGVMGGGGGSYPAMPVGGVPRLGTQAAPAAPVSVSDTFSLPMPGRLDFGNLNTGPAPTGHGADPGSVLPAETRPTAVSTGQALITNDLLPGSDMVPYRVWGDADEAFNLENLPINVPYIAGQMGVRWWNNHLPYQQPQDGQWLDFATPTRPAPSVTIHSPATMTDIERRFDGGRRNE